MGSKIRGKNARRNPKTGAVRPQSSLEPRHRMSFNSKRSNKIRSALLAEAWATPAPSSTKPEDRHFVIDSGASVTHVKERGA